VNHVIYAFDKKTEELIFEVPIPAVHIDQLRKIMAWTEAEDEIYCYDLDDRQIDELETLLNRTFRDPYCDLQLGTYRDDSPAT